MSRPRNPQQRIGAVYRDFWDRDYSLTEKQDYDINIKPFAKKGWAVEAQGDHMMGTFVVRGWKVSNDHSNSR